MKHEKTIKRNDGTRICIEVEYRTGDFISNPKWISVVSRALPKKRNFFYVPDAKQLDFVAPEEIQAVALELWQKMKPSFF